MNEPSHLKCRSLHLHEENDLRVEWTAPPHIHLLTTAVSRMLLSSPFRGFVFIVILCFGPANSSNETDSKSGGNRQKKVFSLFSLVQFKNDVCSTISILAGPLGPFRKGSCYTSSECTAKGGIGSGNCAAGFGVCCLFVVSSSMSRFSQNCTYFRNPGFPSVYSTAAGVSYTVDKESQDVCYLRLDFVSFNILATTDAFEHINPTPGGVCQDSMKIQVNSGQVVPVICGLNTNQHMYLNVGNSPLDNAGITFAFSSTTTVTNPMRQWEIKVTQIPCYSPSRPPDGCLQYFTEPQGRLTTFNFASITSSKINGHLYNICIRQVAGFCCTMYNECPDLTDTFSLDTSMAAAPTTGLVDAQCTLNYITIPGSSPQCSLSGETLHTKYCGKYLGLISPLNSKGFTCDCTAPFMVGIRTFTKAIGLAANTIATNRGICLDYTQVPCTTN